jgi:hypothetical protein
MPDPVASKENEYPAKGKNSKLDRSPVRRKHQTTESTAVSPHKERQYKSDQDFTKPSSPLYEIYKGPSTKDNGKSDLMTPGSFLSSNPKLATSSPKQVYSSAYETPTKNAPAPVSKDCLSTSPTGSGRWAGPAFGNAPHPSNLPLPEFPPMASPSILHAPRPLESYLSTSPPGHDPYLGMVYQHPPSPPPHYLPHSPPSTHLSSIPVVPFPYVGVMPVTPPLSLAQLSTDLRRMLNINDIPSAIQSDPILVSANSS